MTKLGIQAYATAKYTRLALDKHIESTRQSDIFVNKITDKRPSILFLGANGDTPPDCPIKIKKHVRCPGTRILVRSIKKRGDCIVVPTNEWGSSQTCPHGLHRFEGQAKSAKFKMCRCVPDARTLLPDIIVSKLGKYNTSTFRQLQRTMNEERGIHEELMSNVKVYYKKWEFDRACSALWQRDTSAAKVIMVKGKSIWIGTHAIE